MARPFRFGPPAPAERRIPRPRLDAALARRRDVRLVTVVAGPGLGKTSLLARHAPPSDDADGLDVWITCEPADAAEGRLCADVSLALGAGPLADTSELLSRVWSEAPRPVTFVFDDVHEVAGGSAGASFLDELVVELPANGHVVLASRAAVPVPTARLAAAGQLVRLGEADLLLDADELVAFAAARGVDPDLLQGTGGWPALAELTASAGSELVYDFLWEEVLRRAGDARARRLAAFAVVGGGDDEVATAVAGVEQRVDDLVGGLPLVLRNRHGAALHPLWAPVLRPLLTDDEARRARLAAAEVHRRRDAYATAIDLLAEADAWDDVLAVIRDAAGRRPRPRAVARRSEPRVVPPALFGRWYAQLPVAYREHPAARLAAGLRRRRGDPTDALPHLEAAASGFRAAGDVDGEAAALAGTVLVHMWRGDLGALLRLHPRTSELADAGASAARGLDAIASALLAHLRGDSPGVHAALAAVDADLVPGWGRTLRWFEAVALRRDGELTRSLEVVDAVAAEHPDGDDLYLQHAATRARWLLGEVERACVELVELERRFRAAGDDYNAEGAVLELAQRRAWLGDADGASSLLRSGEQRAAQLPPGAMAQVMRALARASILVAGGDDAGAAAEVRDLALRTLATGEGWYWWDRGAAALVRVLVPESAELWAAAPLGPCHTAALHLGEALEEVRRGGDERVRALMWPSAGVLRASLPSPWLVELVAAAEAAGNGPPADVVDGLRDDLRRGLAVVAARSPGPLADGAGRVARQASLPARRHVEVRVLGPLEVLVDGAPVAPPELRRARVRELLAYLVARRRVRREEVAEDLWPDTADSGRNLRVTLTYLQRVLEPDRPEGSEPHLLRSEGPWLVLEPGSHLAADLWALQARLEEGAAADRRRAPGATVDAYLAALPLWRGEPFADQPYADWAQPLRVAVVAEYVAAARRAAELLLAGGDAGAAAAASAWAVRADPFDERSQQLLARCRRTSGDLDAAPALLAPRSPREHRPAEGARERPAPILPLSSP